MKFNVSDPTEPKLWKKEWIGANAYLDGKLIKWVFYADEEAGIIKTYWIEGFMSPQQEHESAGALRAEGYTLADFAGREISLDGGIVRETLRGKVRIELP